ncbi:MAG TPA: DUF4394 domain-containing protein [Thermoleophilaceae bacterium]
MALRLARWTCVVAALAAAVPAAASADPAAGITGSSDLALFDTANPAGLTSRPITGLQTTAETVVGLDFRPATGQLFLITVPTGVLANAIIRSYSLDPATATATFVGSIPINTVPGAADVPTGADFNPVVDRLRVVNAGNENFRVNPNNAALAGDDVNLTYTAPATEPVTAVAYDRNLAPGPPGTIAPAGTLTTLYGIDVGADRLVTIGGVGAEAPGGPNGGTVRAEGTLAVAVDDASDAGFDIAANGSAFASLMVGGQAGLYRVNLAGGTATLIGALPAEVRALTVTGPDNCPGVAGDDQADLDGDGQGDACDSDIDGDGADNTAETASGTDPRNPDSDGDGVSDGADLCPRFLARTANGCDELAPKITFTKTPRRITRKRLFKGVRSRIAVDEAASLDVALLGRARSVRVARAGDVVLAERHLRRSARTRTVSLKPKRRLLATRARFSVRLRVTATDAAGNSRTRTKTIRVRNP